VSGAGTTERGAAAGAPARRAPGPTRTRRITIDLRMLNHSGIGTYLRNTVPALIAERPEIHFTLLGAPEELRTLPGADAANCELREFRAPIYSIAEQVGAWRLTPRGTDLYWSPHYTIPLLRRGKLLVTVCDVCHLALPHLFGGLHRRLYAKLMFAAVRRKADAIITISEFTRREFLRLVGPARQEIHAITLAAPERWFSVRPTRNPEPAPYVLYVGNVKPHKNLTTLLEAMRLLPGDVAHNLVIVGKESGFLTGDPRVRERAAALGDRVRFTGRVSDEALEQYVAHADALVFPSLYEGFGLPPLEAMACGCPVVVSNAASLPEVCGDAAVYIDPLDPADLARQLRRVLGDATLREELRARGRARARQFSYDDCVRRTLAVVDELLAR